MSDFVFALNATMPIFLIILLGYILKRLHILTEAFCVSADKYVFKCALPVSLFQSIAQMDVYSDFSLSFFLFCLIVTSVVFLGTWALAWRFKRQRGEVGAFSQASVRSSAAILGLTLATNIYGNTGKVPMMILASVPFFNIYSVLMLTFSPCSDEDGNPASSSNDGSSVVRRAVINVAKNPIILGILAGLPFALLGVTLPKIPATVISNIGGTSSPMALLTVGASFSGSAAMKKWKPAVLASLIKLFVLPGLFLPLAVFLGFRNTEMVALLIMLGAPTTVSCYIMAKNMHQDHILTSNTIVLTTLFSSISLTLWLFMLKRLNVL